jgi:uncharacterized membrane protein
MAATIVWIGGVFFQAAILIPLLSKAPATDDQTRILEAVRRRFNPLAWLSLAVLITTGLTQMSASPNYRGFLTIANLWSVAILTKHLIIGLMIAVSLYQSWVLDPQLSRSALARAVGSDAGPDPAPLQARQALSIRLNLVLGILVLALTAVARTA